MNHTTLFCLSGFTAVYLSFVFFEYLYSKCLSEKVLNIIAQINMVVFFAFPFVWIIFTFKILKLLCLFIVFDLFMILVMWPHAADGAKELWNLLKSTIQPKKVKNE